MGRRPARHAELAETLDRVLHEGAVLRGDLVLSVADIDLLYLDVRLFLSSVDKAVEAIEGHPVTAPASADDSLDSEDTSDAARGR